MPLRKIGTVVKELRDEKSMTQVELAKKAKVTQSYVARLEAGNRKNPSMNIVQRLAKALGVPVTNLLE